MPSRLSQEGMVEAVAPNSWSLSQSPVDVQFSDGRYLICQTGELRFALAVAEIIEIMRPLPLKTLRDSPPYLLGVSIIRGRTVPVVDTSMLLFGHPISQPGRLVIALAGGHQVALAVDSVLGMNAIPQSVLRGLPALMGSTDSASIAAIGVLDEAFLILIQAAYAIPPAVWLSLGDADEVV